MMQHYKWPTLPYKGLSFYSGEDVLIFAGRDQYIAQCAQVLSRSQTRILILNGPTGCGKSSFLRAGLIPFLDSRSSSFQFLQDHGGDSVKALFIRSTDSPLVKLAEQIYEFASKDIEVETAMGTTHVLKLTKILMLSEEISEPMPKTDFLETIGKDPKLMIKTLHQLSKKLSQTLVLIIDQGEEVLTLKPGKDGDESRRQFFEFMSLFSHTSFDLKLLVALRSEFYSRFYDEFQVEGNENVSSFYLRDLTEEQIVQAIIRPTKKENLFGFGSPHEQYKFSYEERLPERIAADLINGNLQGGVLPVLQVVCNRIYLKTKQKAAENSPWVITEADYASLGSIEEQMEDYLRKTLYDMCQEQKLPGRERLAETARWRDVLSLLAKPQADGTVTTDFKTAEDLARSARDAKCNLNFDIAMNYLSSDDTRILRSFEVINRETNQPRQCYSLGHDTIGLVLQRWKVSREEKKSANARVQRNMLIIGIVILVFGFTLLALKLLSRFDLDASIIFMLISYGLLFILNPLISNSIYGNSSHFSLKLRVTVFPSSVKKLFITDSYFREELRQYPDLSDRFESYLSTVPEK